MVPSNLDSCFRATVGTVMRQVWESLHRSAFARLLISSKDLAPRCSQVNTCFARKDGSPIS